MISVIIPVYNSGKYLSECLDSILNQSFSDLEIICVDDGSVDNSLDILKSYKKKDKRLKIISQDNRGLSGARNTGLKNANGKYILFLDSDDILELDSCEKLYSMAENDSLDLILFKIINFDDETREKSVYSYFELEVLKKLVGNEIFNYDNIKEKFFRIPVTAPGKFYKKELIDGMKFQEGLIFEDNLFFAELLFNLKKAKVLDEYLYLRRIRPDSIINSNFSKFKDCVVIYNMISDVIKEYGKYEDLKGQLFHRKCRDIYLRFSQVPDEFKGDFFNIIKKDFKMNKDILENDGTLEIASKRSLEIFNKAIESVTFHEFELSVEIFDLKKEISKLKKENKEYNGEINKSSSRISFKNIFRNR